MGSEDCVWGGGGSESALKRGYIRRLLLLSSLLLKVAIWELDLSIFLSLCVCVGYVKSIGKLGAGIFLGPCERLF